jgi:hypothetical protein
MKLALPIVIFSFILGGMFTAHAAHLFDKATVPYNGSSNINLTVTSIFNQFTFFLPIAIIYYGIAIILFGFPLKRFPYILFIGISCGLVIVTAINSLFGSPFPQLSLTTKYGEHIDFPITRTLQLIGSVFAIFIYIRRFKCRV